jgi:hypothetical protein
VAARGYDGFALGTGGTTTSGGFTGVARARFDALAEEATAAASASAS